MMPEGAPPQQLPVSARCSSTRELLDSSNSAARIKTFLNATGGTAACSEPIHSRTSGEACDTSQQRRRGNRRSTLVRKSPGTECPPISLAAVTGDLACCGRKSKAVQRPPASTSMTRVCSAA